MEIHTKRSARIRTCALRGAQVVLVLMGLVFGGRAEVSALAEVKVSSFGYDAADATRFLQAALDSGARKVVVDRQAGPWISNPLYARSNTEIVFEDGAEILAKRGAFMLVRGNSLLSLECVTNVTVRGLGRGGTLRMWKKDYQAAPYAHSEWRHALNIMSAQNILVENMSMVSSGGDGIYLGVKVPRCPNVDVVIRGCVCDDNHRQGISVISAVNLLIEKTVMKNTCGTPPEAGIDFEPNSWTEKMVNCVMRDCVTSGNRGAGYDLYFGQLDGRTDPITITFENCQSLGDRRTALPLSFKAEKASAFGFPKGGFLKVKGCLFKDNASGALQFRNKPLGVCDATIEDCVFDNCPTGRPAAAVSFVDNGRTLPPTDGVAFRNVTIRRAPGGDWFKATKRPWLEKGITGVTGEVTLEEGGVPRTVKLDEAWGRAQSPSCGQKLVLSSVPFDAAAAKRATVVDNAPGVRVKLSPARLRYGCSAVIYAAKPGPVTFSARVFRVGKRPMEEAPFTVSRLGSRKALAKLGAPGEKPVDFTFVAPAAGFYSLKCALKAHALVFADCDAPIGFLPPEKGFDIFASVCDFYFAHAPGVDATFFCGGGIGEYVSAKLFDPAGQTVGAWDSIGDWGFSRVAPEAAAGLWRVSVSRPARGLVWEDSFLELTGQSSVFFLSPEKYWR